MPSMCSRGITFVHPLYVFFEKEKPFKNESHSAFLFWCGLRTFFESISDVNAEECFAILKNQNANSARARATMAGIYASVLGDIGVQSFASREVDISVFLRSLAHCRSEEVFFT